jgi:hypothetical protein
MEGDTTMSEFDERELIYRAVRAIREEFADSGQPWYWPRHHITVHEGYPPDAALTYSEHADPENLNPKDVVIHGVVLSTEETDLCPSADENGEDISLLSEIEEMPANYRWLVLPDDLDLDDAAFNHLSDECDGRGIGLILCHTAEEENSDEEEESEEIVCMAEPVEGEFLSDYDAADIILRELTERATEASEGEEEEEGMESETEDEDWEEEEEDEEDEFDDDIEEDWDEELEEERKEEGRR